MSDLGNWIADHPAQAYEAYWGPGAGFSLMEHIPEHLQSGLVRYLLLGVRPGRFLTAALEGDLFEAVKRGDEKSVAGLRGIVMFLYNSTSTAAYGSREKVNEWCDEGGWIAIREKERSDG